MIDSNDSMFGTPIPIIQRIRKIMEEKGSSHSIRAVASRLPGMSKDKLLRMLNGNRYCSPTELQMIIDSLHISEERIKQTDTASLVWEIRKQLKYKTDLPKAMQLAEQYGSIALGASERCDAMNFLAHVLFEMGDYERSHSLWLEAYEKAQEFHKKTGNTDRLYAVLNNLLVSYTARKEYLLLAATLNQVESVFESDPEIMGGIYYSKAKIAKVFDNREVWGENVYKSLAQLELSGVSHKIGRAQINVADYEYRMKNYTKAKTVLQQAIKNLEGDLHVQSVAIKELGKVLLKLEQHSYAAELIKNSYHLVLDKPVLKGKYDLLLSIATGDPSYAEHITLTATVGTSVRALACRYLITHYTFQGDSAAVMKYHKMEDRILHTTDVLDKEEF